MCVILTRTLRSRHHYDLCFTDTETNQMVFSQDIVGSGGRSIEFLLNLTEDNFFLIYLFMIVTERERGKDIGRGRSRLHAPGA